MKKKLIALLMSIAVLATTVACGPTGEKKNDQAAGQETAQKQDGDLEVVRWNSGTSGNIMVTIANQKGYFEDEGLKIENIPADANADALTMLATDKVDVVSNAGTSNPLQQIASGVDLTIFGGHMVTGAMPVVAKKGTGWNGVEDLIGKKFACNPSYFAFTGAVMDLGYDDPLKAVDWVTYTDYNDALAAVQRGEVDYALMGTGQNYNVKNMDDIEIVTYQSDVMPKYSCCRMVAQTKFVNEKPETVKKIIKALLRAQDYYENNKEEAVGMLAKEINASEEYVASYMLDEKHYNVSVDPLKNSVERAWDILDKTGFLDEHAKDIDIADHVNTKIYKEALDEAKAQYGKEDPKFYEKMEQYFEENNK